MSIHTLDLTRWNRAGIGLGGVAWVLLVLMSILGWRALNDLEVILLLALCVITPLAVPLAAPPRERPLLSALFRLIMRVQPFAALIGGVSFLLGAGPLAAGAAAAWLLFTLLLALLGVGWLRESRNISLAEVCLAIALVYVPIGGAWLVVARLGWQPIGFGQHTSLLTAVHFHYIPLAALIMTGCIGQHIPAARRAVPRMLYRVAALGMLVNPLLVAAGITLAQLIGENFLEPLAAVLLALSLILIAFLSLRFIIPSTASPLARGLLLVSSTAVCFTMLAAGAYALGAATGAWTISISQMIAVHGWINALIFGLCGLLGWRLRAQQKG
jgi:hypothetical protein